MIALIDNDGKKKIMSKIIKDVDEFQKLDKGSKLKCADKLYSENKILKELGEIALDVIEELSEKHEVEKNKVNILENELKIIDSYDEIKINRLMNENPVIMSNNRERAKRELINKINRIK